MHILAKQIEHFVSFNLRVDYNMKVKVIRPHSLLQFKADPDPLRVVENVTLPGFLERDSVHLNYWGYQALVNELAIPLMDQQASVLNYKSRDFPGKIHKSILQKRCFTIP